MVEITGTSQKAAWDAGRSPRGRAGPSGAVVDPGTHPEQPPALCARLRSSSSTTGSRMVDAGWNTDEAWEALCDGLAEAGGSIDDVRAVARHPHPPRPLRAGRPGPRGVGGLGRAPSGRRARCSRALRRDRRAGRPHDRPAGGSRGCPRTSDPTWPIASMEISSLVTMAEPDVLFEDDQRFDLRAGTCAPSGPRATPPGTCASTRPTTASCSRATTSCPGSPRTSPSTPSRSPTRSATTSVLGQDAFADHRRGPAGPRVPLRRPGRPHRRDHRATTRTASRRSKPSLAERPGHRRRGTSPCASQWSRPWDEIPNFMQRTANGETLAHLRPAGSSRDGATRGRRPGPLLPRRGHGLGLERARVGGLGRGLEAPEVASADDDGDHGHHDDDHHQDGGHHRRDTVQDVSERVRTRRHRGRPRPPSPPRWPHRSGGRPSAPCRRGARRRCAAPPRTGRGPRR